MGDTGSRENVGDEGKSGTGKGEKLNLGDETGDTLKVGDWGGDKGDVCGEKDIEKSGDEGGDSKSGEKS